MDPQVKGAAARQLSEYSALLEQVRQAGLLRRRHGFYVMLAALLVLALALTVRVMVLVGDSWWQLLPAAALGVILAQFGFVAHEAAHREIFQSVRANDRVGRLIGNLVVGISYSWWKSGHNRHHANPNLMGKDPSVARGAFTYTTEDSAESTGIVRWLRRHQGVYFYPLLLPAGVNLQVQSELALAPNHVGMPVLARGTRLDFLRRQVLTSRNIHSPNWVVTAWMGGLDYQIEHHLFPSMPRPALRRASALTKAYCAERGIPYTESRLFETYAFIARHLDEVGRPALEQPTRCPVASRYGR